MSRANDQRHPTMPRDFERSETAATTRGPTAGREPRALYGLRRPRRERRLLLLLSVAAVLLFSGAIVASAQLPADAVDLALVKITEVQKSEDLSPVTLEPSATDGERWTYEGVAYRGGEPGVKERFMAAPDTFAEAHRKQRWVNNFMMAMSTIWCPITDEVTPGGRKRVEGLGHSWESCCSFCDDEMRPENFGEALVRLEERAREAYELTGGAYAIGAKSPVEGAIRSGY